MSMISSQCDELRNAAEFYDGFKAANLMREAADLILELRDNLQCANEAVRDAEHDESMAWDRVRKAEAENAKLIVKLNAEHIVRQNVEIENARLRELVADMLHDAMENVCSKAYWCDEKNWQTCNDKSCGCYSYVEIAHELGVEVDG